jgi:hypothetical protein
MRRIAKGIAALTLASGAVLGSFAAVSAAQANSLVYTGPVKIEVKDVASGNTVEVLNYNTVSAAALVCGINATTLSLELFSSDYADCPGKSGHGKKAYAKKG